MASIRKRGDTFTITGYLGYDAEGRQIKKTTTYRPPDGVTSGKAEKLAREYATIWEQKIRGYVALDENRTFADLSKWYFENIAPNNLKENVMIDNLTMINTYTMPTLARKKLKEISPAMLDTLFQELRTNGRVKDVYRLKDVSILKRGMKSRVSRETGLSRHTVTRLSQGLNAERDSAERIAAHLGLPFDDVFVSAVESRELQVSSVARIKRCLSAIFTAAVKKEIMQRNPCTHTITLKRPRSATSFLDEKQSLALVTALESHKDFQFRTMINTLLFTGMRGGELCGMLWDDVDLEKGIIFIRHTLAYHRGKGENKYVLQDTKTAAGERYVIVPPSIVAMLREHRQKQNERREALGAAWIARGTVFTGPIGNYHAEAYLNTKFKKYAKKIALPDDIHIHSLRHTTASLLINADVSPKVISEQLGHASTAITQDLYSHVFASSKARAMQALEIALTPTTNS